jgi:hypothetical protein
MIFHRRNYSRILAAWLAVAPAALPEDAPMTVETIAATPAWWPKQVSLVRVLAVPVVVNGKVAGEAQLPAGTMLRLLRVVGAQVEVEYQGGRHFIPAAATDLGPRALALKASAPAGSTASVAPAPAAPAPNSPSAPAADPALYGKRAREVMAEIQKTFYNAHTGLYARSTTDAKPDFMWGNGVMFSALVGAARHEPAHYRPILEKFFEGLGGYWDPKAKVPGYEPGQTSGNGHDKYYDDNAWMVLTFLEAYELTHRPHYLKRAGETLDFVLSGWDDVGGGGIWWHEQHKGDGKNTCANAPAAVGCLWLAKRRDARAAAPLNEKAQAIVTWTAANLQGENGLFWDNKKMTTGEVNRGTLTYNSALMIRAFLGLHRLTGKREPLEEARRIARAGDDFLRRSTGVYRDPVKWSHLMVEADLELYRVTREDYLLQRARKNADAFYTTWKTEPPSDLISQASIARTLWLLADLETEVGRSFWQAVDKSGR